MKNNAPRMANLHLLLLLVLVGTVPPAVPQESRVAAGSSKAEKFAKIGYGGLADPAKAKDTSLPSATFGDGDDDPFFASPTRPPGAQAPGVRGRPDDDFFAVGGDGGNFDDDDFFNSPEPDERGPADGGLPPCESLTPIQLELGIPCSDGIGGGGVPIPPEVRHRDALFERLLSQTWSDFQVKLNREARLYGKVVDPLDIDALLPKPIDLRQVGSGYSADVKMDSIMMHGLSGINLTAVSVTRSENLTDLRASLVFSFDELLINGSYSLQGFVGWWKIDSVGVRPFNISMVKANVTFGVTLDMVDPFADLAAAAKCLGSSAAAFYDTESENVLITDISIVLKYEDINFRFDNLGSFANTAVNAIGLYALETQEALIVNQLRKLIKANVNSLIC